MTDRYLLEAMREVDEPQVIKPCPFCGRKELTVLTNMATGYTRIQCEKCYALGPETRAYEPGSERARETAIYGWNMRAPRPTETIDSDGRPIGRT